jgi:hypothetical protein
MEAAAAVPKMEEPELFQHLSIRFWAHPGKEAEISYFLLYPTYKHGNLWRT